jgi:hypothetical protein
MTQLDLLYDSEPIGLVAARLSRKIYRAESAGDAPRHDQLRREWSCLAKHVGGGDFYQGAVELCLQITIWVRTHGRNWQ